MKLSMKAAIVAMTLLCGGSLFTRAAYTKITPGESWNDVNGSFINAHGSCVVFHQGTYYWFGEDRTGSKSNGVSCYTSTDLFNWKRVGLVFKTSQAFDPETGNAILERPKVIYNESTGKWVMWSHWENGNDYGRACVCVAYADNITGPYTYSGHFRPNERDSRDQNIIIDADGQAYHLCATDMNTNISIIQLSDDYLTPREPRVQSKAFAVRRLEAVACIRVDETIFSVFSECDGWNPTPGHAGWTTDILGTWHEGENFCVDDGKSTTYSSQSACLFKVDGYDQAYVYVGDRWNSSNVGSSKQVWLPLSLRTGHPVVRWYKEWNMDAFKDVDRYRRAAAVGTEHPYVLIEKFSDRFIGNKNGRPVLTDNGPAEAMQFTFIPVEGKKYTYYIKEEGTGTYLESSLGSLRMSPTRPAGEAGQWFMHVEEEGTYLIRNLDSQKYLAVSGASTAPGMAIYLADGLEGKHASFGLYADVTVYPDEPLAPMYKRAYRDDNARLMAEQEAYLESAGIDGVSVDGALTVAMQGRTLTTGEGCTADVIDAATGRVLLTARVEADLSALAAGVYLVRVTDGQHTRTTRIALR